MCIATHYQMRDTKPNKCKLSSYHISFKNSHAFWLKLSESATYFQNPHDSPAINLSQIQILKSKFQRRTKIFELESWNPFYQLQIQ